MKPGGGSAEGKEVKDEVGPRPLDNDNLNDGDVPEIC